MQRRARRGFRSCGHGLLAGLIGLGLWLGAPSVVRASEAPVDEPDPAQVKAEKLERLNRRIDRARAAGRGRVGSGGEPDAQPPASASDGASWSERLAAAKQRLSEARERLAAANAVYARARHDRDARGEALKAIKDERVAARDAFHAARTELPELVEQARRAGVLPSVLRPYED